MIITGKYISSILLKDEIILLSDVKDVKVSKVKVKDYRQGAAFFFLLAVIFMFIMPPLGLWFLVMAIAARLYVSHQYNLIVCQRGYDRLVDAGSWLQTYRWMRDIRKKLV